MKNRLRSSLLVGMLIAAALVAFEANFRHAALVASAAKSGGHQTVTSILADGFIGATIGVTVLVFVLATLGAGRQRRAATRRQDSMQRRRIGHRADSWR
jgi:hypothetical protein